MKNTESAFIPDDMRAEMSLRVERLQEIMERAGCEAMLVAGNAGVYYLTGRFFRGYVYVPRSGHATYFIIRPNCYEASDELAYIRKPEQIPDEMGRLGIPLPGNIALEYDSLTYADVERLKAVFPAVDKLNASPLLRRARMVKTPFEIKLMEQDGLHQAAAYRRIPHLYKEDMTDVEFQIEIERALRLEGCLGTSRVAGNLMEINLGSVLSGRNADVPTPYDFALGGAGVDPSLPVGADGSIMRVGTTVMVDMNGSFNGYQTDTTRVWRIGDLSDEAYKAHECSRDILRELERLGRPGYSIADMYGRAMSIVEDAGLKDFFMGHRQQAGFIGHGVGIELNEQPAITGRSRETLLDSMTIAIEPKFVIPGVGAVGVENTYVVTSQGLRCITPYPEEIQEL